MRATSDRFAEEIASSTRLAVSATVIMPTSEEPIDIIDGSVTLDATAASRGRLDLTVPVEYLPTSPTDLLAPYGNEIRVARGIIFSDGTVELVGLGVYRIESAEISDSGSDLTVQVSGIDRSIRIIEAVFEEPYTTPQDVLIHEAIAAGLQVVYPEIEFGEWAETTLRTYGNWSAERGADRWEFWTIWAEAMGCALYFDGDGKATLKPLATGISQPVAVLEEGANGVLLSANRSWSRDDAVNRVVVTGSNVAATGVPAYGEATDDDPFSPTRYGGPFGFKTFDYDASFVEGLGIHDGGGSLIAVDFDAEAAAIAQQILTQKLGTSSNLSVDALVNPALEPSDVIEVTRERAGIEAERHIIDALTIPLGVDGAMSAQSRAAAVIT